MYKYTPDEIASMTPFAQLVMLSRAGTDNTKGTQYFETQSEYEEWLANRG